MMCECECEFPLNWVALCAPKPRGGEGGEERGGRRTEREAGHCCWKRLGTSAWGLFQVAGVWTYLLFCRSCPRVSPLTGLPQTSWTSRSSPTPVNTIHVVHESGSPRGLHSCRVNYRHWALLEISFLNTESLYQPVGCGKCFFSCPKTIMQSSTASLSACCCRRSASA